MSDETQNSRDPEVDGDSSDVVTGPIGSAHLVEPKAAEELGADLEDLPMVPADSDGTASPEGPTGG